MSDGQLAAYNNRSVPYTDVISKIGIKRKLERGRIQTKINISLSRDTNLGFGPEKISSDG